MKRAYFIGLLALVACGDDGPGLVDSGPTTDTATVDTGPPLPDTGPLPDAGPASVCGDGVVSGAEQCDTDIAEGEEGACPTECPNEDLCISATLAGTACSATCEESMITEFVDDDMCCPEGGTPDDDNDCRENPCGNGMVDIGEVCDTAIPAGEVGACATTCDDGIACTSDDVTNEGTCAASCLFAPVTEPNDDDMCCPAGAVFADDNDCSETCGNGTVEEGETCDTTIDAGSDGACPTTCDDEVACTLDALQAAGTCNAECTATPITGARNDDMCCPSGANANSDNDCMPVCPNGVRESGEGCDDGNNINDDACDNMCEPTAPTTAFRVNAISLVGPEIYANVGGAFCTGARTIINPQLQRNVDEYNLNAVIAFSPLDPMMSMTPIDVYLQAGCTAGAPRDNCNAEGPVESSTSVNQAAPNVCYRPQAGTLNPRYGRLNVPNGPCFSAPADTVSFNLAGTAVTLTNVTVAGSYGTNTLEDGTIAGFLTFATARATTVDLTSASAGMPTLFELLQSGLPNDGCDTASSPVSDADDLDGDGTDDGWWFFINVGAEIVNFTR
ncbi:MAG: hypothetical protein ACI9KE_001891 [Polyangiales bacterium]|jgi:hypothetical protein